MEKPIVDAILKTDKEYSSTVSKPGLLMADVYSKFCGPCEPILAIVKKWKTEIAKAESSVSFTYVQIQTDEIQAFEKLKNKSMPLFFIFANGVNVDMIKGPNTPVLDKTLKEYASKIAKKNKFQPMVNDMLTLSAIPRDIMKSTTIRKSTDIFIGPPDGQEQSLFLIKPNVQKVNEIRQLIKENSFTIAQEKKFVFTKKQAREFYKEHAEKPFFDNLIQYMTSGPVIAYRVFRGDGIQQLRTILGPPSSSRAKEEAPNSLRAKYGSEGLRNGFHGSDNPDKAAWELKMIFDDSIRSIHDSYSKIHDVPPKQEQTLLIIKPEVVGRHQLGLVKMASMTNLPPSKSINLSEMNRKSNLDLAAALDQNAENPLDDILYEIFLLGFDILNTEQLTVSKSHLEQLFGDLDEDAIHDWQEGPSIVFRLYGDNAVSAVKELIGPLSPSAAEESAPDCLCARYGISEERPGFYYPETNEIAIRAVESFFAGAPNAMLDKAKSTNMVESTFAIIKPDISGKTSEEDLKNKLKTAGFNIVKTKSFSLTKQQAEELYADHKDKEYFQELTAFVSSGQLTALLLSRANAVVALRELMGPPDSAKAKETAPDSIRAIFGTNRISNAIYGSDTMIRAQKDISLFFGDTKTSQNDLRSSITNLANRIISTSKSSLKNAAASIRKSANELSTLAKTPISAEPNASEAPKIQVSAHDEANVSDKKAAKPAISRSGSKASIKSGLKDNAPSRTGSKVGLEKTSAVKTGSKVGLDKTSSSRTGSKVGLEKTASKPALNPAPPSSSRPSSKSGERPSSKSGVTPKPPSRPVSKSGDRPAAASGLADRRSSKTALEKTVSSKAALDKPSASRTASKAALDKPSASRTASKAALSPSEKAKSTSGTISGPNSTATSPLVARSSSKPELSKGDLKGAVDSKPPFISGGSMKNLNVIAKNSSEKNISKLGLDKMGSKKNLVGSPLSRSLSDVKPKPVDPPASDPVAPPS